MGEPGGTEARPAAPALPALPALPAVEAWLRTADALLCGLNHALSNRASALAAAPLIAARPAPSPADVERLTAEVAQLESLLRLYRLLERGEHEPVEAVDVADAVADALALLAHHPTTRDLACTVTSIGETPPVLLVPSALVHAVLLLLCAAARVAGEHEPAGLNLSFGGTADWVTMAVETRSVIPGGPDLDVPELPAVRWILRDAAVTESASRTPEGRVRLEMRLATLARSRRWNTADTRERG